MRGRGEGGKDSKGKEEEAQEREEEEVVWSGASEKAGLKWWQLWHAAGEGRRGDAMAALLCRLRELGLGLCVDEREDKQ